MKTITRPVYPIPPSFNNEEMEFKRTSRYIRHLEESGATRVMTTAGSSQFNLLTLDEIFTLNKTVLRQFSKETILGLPAIDLRRLRLEISKLNELKGINTKILILFPERYYNDQQIIDFFSEVCRISDYPVYLHGNILKRGNGGSYEYSNTLLRSLFNIPNFAGMKEEYSSIDLAMKNIADLPVEFDIIVAGGSMRRFWSLYPHGASSFLTGLGSFAPEFSEQFYNSFVEGDYSMCTNIIQNLEKPLFDTFMEIGWHASMRTALQKQGFLLENRKPFVELDNESNIKIIEALNKIKV